MKRLTRAALAALALFVVLPAHAVRAADKTPLASYPGEPTQPIKSTDRASVPELIVTARTTDIQADIRFSGDITPSQITSSQNDYSPSGLSTAAVLRLSTDASRNLTGLQGGADGRWITIVNVGSNDLVLKAESASSSAANRFALPADLTLSANMAAVLAYDATAARWRQIGASGIGAPGGSPGQIQYNNAGAFGAFTLGGDCTFSVPNITCTKTGGVSFGSFATGTDAANLTGTLSASRIAANALALGKLAQIGGSSYLGNQSTSTGDVTAYVWPTCVNDGAHALIYVPGASPAITCPTITAASGGSNPFAIGSANLKSGVGAPSASSDGIGSLYLQTDVSQLWGQVVPSATVPALVQSASGVGGGSATFSATPASGDLLVAACAGYTVTPSANTGWTDSGLTHTPSVSEPGDRWVYKFAVSGESTTQTPCSGGGGTGKGVVIFEVSGVANWTAALESNTFSTGQPVTYTTANANDLVLGAAYGQRNSGDTGPGTIVGLSGGATNAHTTGFGVTGAGQQFASSSSSVSVTYAFTAVTGQSARLIILKPATAGWKLITETWQNAGSTLSTWPLTINCSTGLSCSTDGLDNLTLTATATGTVTHAGSALTAGRLVIGNSAADTTIGLTDVTTDNVTSSAHGLAPKSPADATQFLNGATTPAYAAVKDSDLSTSDVTTNNVSTSKHGFAPKLPNDAGKFLDGTGAYSTPTAAAGGSSGQIQYNLSGAISGFTLGGDCTFAVPNITCTKTSGTNFGTFATQNYATPPAIGGTTPAAGSFSTLTDTGVTGTSLNCAYFDSAGLLHGTGTACGSAVGGTVTSVTSGDGTNFSTITSSGAVTAANLTPAGRLTLVTATCVPTSDQTAKTAIYYTPGCGMGGGNTVPLWDGTYTKPYTFTELTLSLDTTNHPVENVFDDFIWSNSGTISIGAGPAWKNSATITVTIASPAVVTWTAHGLYEGAPVIFTNSGGALPTGITAGTTYYVGKNVTANTFSISTSVANAVAGTYVNTSGSQSGTHTGTNHTTKRGTGAGTTEIELKNGFWANKNSITLTNGAGAGTSGISADTALYVGSFYTTAAGQTGMAFFPAAASGGTANILGLYNAYNRAPFTALMRDNSGNYTFNSSSAWRAANNSASARISYLDGLGQSAVSASTTQYMINSSFGWFGIGCNATAAQPNVSQQNSSATALSFSMTDVCPAALGFNFVSKVEKSSASTQFYNFSSPDQLAGLTITLSM